MMSDYKSRSAVGTRWEGMTIRQAARERCPLDGADAQALEHAVTITELERDKLLDAIALAVEELREHVADGCAGADGTSREGACSECRLARRLAAHLPGNRR